MLFNGFKHAKTFKIKVLPHCFPPLMRRFVCTIVLLLKDAGRILEWLPCCWSVSIGYTSIVRMEEEKRGLFSLPFCVPTHCLSVAREDFSSSRNKSVRTAEASRSLQEHATSTTLVPLMFPCVYIPYGFYGPHPHVGMMGERERERKIHI